MLCRLLSPFSMNCSVFVPTFLPMPEVLIAEYAHTHLPDCRGGLRPWQPWDTLLFLDKQAKLCFNHE
jgi:hypothetical protein